MPDAQAARDLDVHENVSRNRLQDLPPLIQAGELK